MKKLVQEILEMVPKAVQSWPGIEAITYIPSEDDILDPYFFIRFDVYTRESIPGEDQRIQDFHFAGGFESSPLHHKDRFLVHNIPVRVDYKPVSRLPDPGDKDAVAGFISREEGTYPMFRIAESNVLFAASDWFDELQRGLMTINEDVWSTLQEFFLLRMEHHLADFGAAVYRNDPIFQRTALAGFIRGVSSSLFAINRRFEPSARGIQRYLYGLAEIPEGFEGRFHVLLELGTAPERQFEIADMLTRGIFQLAEAHRIQ